MRKQLLASTAIVAAGVIGAASTATAQGLLFTGPGNTPQMTQNVPPVGAPAAGAPRISVGIDGRMRAFFSAIWQSDVAANFLPSVGTSSTPTATSPLNAARGRTTNVLEESRIRFRGTINLDNGFQAGFNMEIRTQDQSNTFAPNNYIFRQQFAYLNSARWGLLQLGTQSSAADTLAYKEPDAFGGRTAIFLHDSHFNTAIIRASAGSSIGALTDTNPFPSGINGVGYYTPRIEGFQFGVSWMPTYNRDNQFTQPSNGPGATYQDIIALGLNFDRTFEVGTGLRVRASAGYVRASNPDYVAAQTAGGTATFSTGLTACTTCAVTGSVSLGQYTLPIRDPYLAHFGLRLAYAGFELGGSYGWYRHWVGGPGPYGSANRYAPGNAGGVSPNILGTAMTFSAANVGDGRVWGLGAAYSYGPAAIAINYINGRSSDCNVTASLAGLCGQRDRLWALSGTASYQLGPGVFLEGVIYGGRIRGNDWNSGTYIGTTATPTAIINTTLGTTTVSSAAVTNGARFVQDNSFFGLMAGIVVNF